MAVRPKRIAGAVRKDGRLIPLEDGQALPPPGQSESEAPKD